MNTLLPKNSIKLLFTLFILNFSFIYSQTNYEEGNTLIDLTHYSSDITSLFASDLNNDGFKELIVGSINDNKILFYKNINGSLQQEQRIIIYEGTSSIYKIDVYSKDLDSDGLNDIIIISDLDNKVSWFRNLGDYNFSSEIELSNNIDRPESLISDDIDNDGDNDIIIGSYSNKNVSIFKNNGDGTFTNPEVIFNSDNEIRKIDLFDLDNNGFLDIISGDDNGIIKWVKNLDGLNFDSPEFITGLAGNGKGFSFIDINSDSFYDIVFTSNSSDNLKYSLNENGISFSSPITIDDSLEDPQQLKVKDVDSDGVLDIVVSTYYNSIIGWYKNNNGSFSNINQITTSVYNPKAFILEDFDNNNSIDIVASSYVNNESSKQKLSLFNLNTTNNVYKETILNFYFKAVNTVKVADLNNDGYNDIVSAYGSLLWNKNLGDSTFSSQIVISNSIENSFVYDIELKDFNNDDLIDIAAIEDSSFKVYKNNGDETFTPIFSVALSDISREIEVSDLNNDNNLDILISFIQDEPHLIKIMNNGGFDFQTPTPIEISEYGFEPYHFKTGDIDNDGDIDIVTSSTEYSMIQWLENDGLGFFTHHLIESEIETNPIELSDIDNDGDLDIVSADRNNPIIYFIKNNNANFGPQITIDSQSAQSIVMGDINNDGYQDIVCTSYDYSEDNEKVFYYLNNQGNGFEDQALIESLGDALSLSKEATLGDLNNDDKLDVISSYYFINTVKYFINSFELSIEEIGLLKDTDSFYIYPNPSSNYISWSDKLSVNNIIIYNVAGQRIYNKVVDATQTLDISHLTKGIYYIVGLNVKKNYFTKFIKD